MGFRPDDIRFDLEYFWKQLLQPLETFLIAGADEVIAMDYSLKIIDRMKESTRIPFPLQIPRAQ